MQPSANARPESPPMRDGGAIRDSIAPWKALESSKTMLLITSAKQKTKICIALAFGAPNQVAAKLTTISAVTAPITPGMKLA